jgi:microsomal dipeptidase-like Zn-dependent dipeptidase
VSNCQAGTIPFSGCSGDCFCGGSANPGAANSIDHCFQPSHCGGEGERACCNAISEGAAGTSNQPCESGKTRYFGCSGDCQCGGNAAQGVNALDTCLTMSPCGGENQRACCVSEGAACNDGLEKIPGCTGDCFCEGSTSVHTCVKLESGKLKQIAQPDTGRATAPAEARTCALRGYADIHVHMFSDTAHGGGVLSGAAYDPANDNVNVALRPDYGTHRDLVTKTGGELPTPTCPSWISDCGEKLFHGDHFPLVDDAVGSGTGDDTGSPLGAPVFNGWPTWHTTTHQQVYYKWLERAYQGGLRLISMLAVTNEALCLSNKHVRGTDCADSMAAIDDQLDEAVAFETFLDAKSGGPGQGWFRIVRTPAEARQVIADGKLAVVLGIEVDNLFNCHWNDRGDTEGDCTPDGIRQKVQEYYDLGVRHIFPIHNFNNAYGGPATWQDAIDVGNRASEGHWWSPTSETNAASAIIDCSGQGYGFKLSSLMQAVITLLGFPSSVIPLNDAVPDYGSVGATCNPIGLTTLGGVLMDALMDHGMIIDVDHMSIKALNETLALASARDYPVVASHVQFFDLNQSTQRHERMRSRAQLEAIRNGGGMIAAMLKDDSQDSLGGKTSKKNVAYTTSPSGVSIPDNCRHSTKTFAQMYQYAVDVMGGPVALGSDFNGVAGHIGPRFGPDGCGTVINEWAPEYRTGNRLAYPFDLADIGEPGFGTFGKQVSGGKSFDFNVDGLAHIGLLPDLVADLAQVGLPEPYLDEMFDSAEEFVRVWERANGGTGGDPVAACEPATANADSTCHATASIATAAEEADPTLTLTQNPLGPYGLGRTSVTLTIGSSDSCATDNCNADVTVVDRTGPSMTCATPPAAECAGATTPVTFAAPSISDNCGVSFGEGCTPASGSGFAFGNTVVSCGAHDGANPPNQSSCTTTVRVVDTTDPSITCPAPQTLECTGEENAAATLTASASDVCAGSVTATCPASGSAFPVGTTPVSCSASDPSGNTSECMANVTVVDTTPPTITCPESARVEADPVTCMVNLPDITAQADPGDICTPRQDLVVTQDPPPGTPLPAGQHFVELQATDHQGLKSVSCAAELRISLPINRNPNLIRFLEVRMLNDFLRLHGRISPCQPIDFSAADFAFVLSNSHGTVYSIGLPAGAIERKSERRWMYRNRDAKLDRLGISDLRIKYSPHRNVYEVRMHTYGDSSRATEPEMTTELRFGTLLFARTATWKQDPAGWHAKALEP